jgi:hypothetical protein
MQFKNENTGLKNILRGDKKVKKARAIPQRTATDAFNSTP